MLQIGNGSLEELQILSDNTKHTQQIGGLGFNVRQDLTNNISEYVTILCSALVVSEHAKYLRRLQDTLFRTLVGGKC